jgi:hypothetical protein
MKTVKFLNPQKTITPRAGHDGICRKANRFAGAVAGYSILITVLSANTALRAADVSETATNSPAPSTSEVCAPPAPPLMAGLTALGIGNAISKANLNLYGYVEAGYFHDFSSPNSGTGPTFIGFNSYKNTVVLNKIDMSLERTVDATQKQFDAGFHVEGLWGTDAPFIHSNGLLDNQTGRYQWDLVQAYVDVAVPGLPMRIRAGKWIELAGFEQFSANIYGAFGDPSKAFYTYSYQFLYAEPGTQAGVLATYFVNTNFSFDMGVTRGWNQSLEDNNGSVDFLGRATFTPSDKTSIIFVTTIGPEYPAGVGSGQPSGDNSDTWVALDLVATQKITDNLSLGFGGDFVNATHIPGYQGSQQWGGVAGYVTYAISPRFTLNNRLEWYGDSSGFSTGAPVGANYYEESFGVAFKPAPHNRFLSSLVFRPEIRYDYSDQPVFDSGEHNQWTFSADALFTF